MLSLATMITTAALLLLAMVGYSHASLPVTAPSVAIGSQSSGSCPSQSKLEAARDSLMQNVSDIILETVLPVIQQQRSPCGCNLPGNSWKRIAFLDTSSSQPCPSAWNLIRSPLTACGRRFSTRASCNSAVYSSNGTAYTQVCGRITGIQSGSTNAFNSSIEGVGIEGSYLDGISLTRGQPGSREHVWSFANAYYDTSIRSTDTKFVCPCMYPNWPHTIPSFVGNNYFCATSGRSRNINNINDRLWDSVGCTSSNTCCKFNQPPWFCKTLPNATSEDLEVRICGDQSTTNEDTYITNMEIYVK